MPTVHVNLAHTSYPIVIGSGRQAQLRSLVTQKGKGGKLFIIFDAQLYALHGARVLAEISPGKARPETFVLPQGEAAKTDKVLRSLYDFLLANEISRSDLILACGGGVTTDVVGYAAATILRGVKWGAIPTTLLGMVDAAIGGKTGINHSLGKNLIGAIWQPAFVSCDLTFLQTLPRREMIAGCGELLKYAGLIGQPMVASMERYLTGGDLLGSRDLPQLVSASAAFKAAIVSQDEREQNIRAYLNLGHTFGHAIENVLGYGRLLHGEAVILGLEAALNLSEELRPQDQHTLKHYHALVSQALTMVPRRKLDSAAIIEAMSLDKKRSSSGLRFVLLSRPGKPYLYDSASKRQVGKAIERMLTVYNQYGGRHAAHSGR